MGTDSDARERLLYTSLGMVAATVALVGTAVPVRDGTTTPVAILALVSSIALLGVFVAQRHDFLSGRIGFPVAILAAAVTVGAAIASIPVVSAAVTIPAITAVPLPVIAVIGGGTAGVIAVGGFFGLPAAGMFDRFVATLVYSAIGGLGFLAMQLWAILLLAIIVFTLPEISTVDQLGITDRIVLSQTATVLGIATVAGVYLSMSSRGFGYIDLSVPSTRDVGYLIGGFFALVGAAVAIGYLMNLTGTETATHGTIEQAQDTPEILLLMIPASILVIGPFEELLYRNVIQKSLYEYFSRPGAVVAASIPFALVHFPAYSGGTLEQSILSLSVVLTLSLLLGAIYERTENLVVPALVHGGYNALIFYNQYAALT